MALQTLNTIKDWFKTGLKPSQTQFWDTWDSFRHKNDKVPVAEVEGLDEIIDSKADKMILDNHLTDDAAHADLFNDKEDKTQKGAPDGYAPLDEFTKLAAQYLNIVNDLVTGGAESLLSAEQGKVLQMQVNAINNLLTSDNMNLDTLQELVDAVETVQASLSTILVNDLTTGGMTKALTAEMGKLLQTNKVDKVAGERLINAAEITKLAGLNNVVTTVRTILSTVLATQDIAGFVTYINTLATPLIIGPNEIVEYKTSDTGRVFKLLLRGRSFGVGQPAIVAADVIETTEFLNKDIRLSNYPSTRNDGQLPTNKVLAPDVNGNLKLYTIATAPAPYLDEIKPYSCLPNSTGNIVLKGAFFTPNMTVQIVGQTINYVKFINDNEVHANVTTGIAEGSFDIILNNGLSATFDGRMLIVLGEIKKVSSADWTILSGNPNVSNDGNIELTLYDIACSGTCFNIPNGENFRLYFTLTRSPLGATIGMPDQPSISLVSAVDNSVKFAAKVYLNGADINSHMRVYQESTGLSYGKELGNVESFVMKTNPPTFYFERIGTEYRFRDYNTNILFTDTFSGNLKVRADIRKFDITNIRYVKLAI
ncbi:hypothetical protein [Flavobacterium polysaccharolyticum]|uniref:Uncharacterized protein n=1 Tax=Flavobacterium polysaccharolyticum TaxID=3133148 RepID=A0ABU9NIJ3_9FLAO